jgi:hypothetical protein
MKGRWVNDELERMWKEAAVAQFKVLPGISLEGLRKTLEKLWIVGLRAEIFKAGPPE